MKKEKQCPGCGKIKSLDEFHRTTRYKDGRVRKCAVCINKRANELKEQRRNAPPEDKDPKKIPSGKIFCPRGEGKIMARTKCLRGCNDACFTCEHRNDDTLALASESVSPEEEREERYAIQSIAGRCVSARDSATRPFFRGD